MTATQLPVGSIAWTDLTVDDATGVRDFYQAVTGWQPVPLEMGGYPDFVMQRPESEDAVAGICHARGTNAGLPTQWLVYIVVADLDESIGRCKALGGRIVAGPKASMGNSRYCVIQDPAGAVAALIAYEAQAGA